MSRTLLLASLALAFALSPRVHAQQAACDGGRALVGSTEYACQSVNLLGRVSLSQMGASAGNDVWGWTDPETGKEYALMGLYEGTAFVDISTPTAPVYLGRLPSNGSGYGNVWRDIKVYQDHAYVVSEASGHGMQVFDLRQLRDVEAPTTFDATGLYVGVGSAHNVAINKETGFAYIVGASGNFESGCAGGLHMVDIRNPAEQPPTFAGCFSADGYTHDVQCVVYDGPDADHQGQEVCFASNEDTVTIVDVTDKADPVELSEAIYPNTAYTHQGWLTEDHRYFIADDEIDEGTFGFNTRTLVFDVTDLDEPQFIEEFFHPVAATDHNLYVKGRYVYQANYKSGLRIVDLGDDFGGGGPPSLAEVAFFDTYPQSNTSGYEGAWSTYPFFESGVVVVSDIDGGLFVLDPQLGGATTDAEAAAPGAFTLGAAYPNPTSGRTHVDLALGSAQHVDVVVYDVLGRRVADLFHGRLAAGEARTFAFDGTNLPAGLYFIRATGEDFAETRQVSLAR
jgi:choice-of-anchor B domain-containing protein